MNNIDLALPKNNPSPIPEEAVEENKQQEETGKDKIKSVVKYIFLTIKYIIKDCIFFLVVFIVYQSLFATYYIPSTSMSPTIPKSSFVLTYNFLYGGDYAGLINRGDKIVFWDPDNNVNMCKRVIGIPDDVILIENGKVFINGVECKEDYAVGSTYVNSEGDSATYRVPERCVFVMGDNREHSLDSRYRENPYVNIYLIKGKIIFNKVISPNSLFAENALAGLSKPELISKST